MIAGKLNGQFPLRIWQTGSGTQTNMNAKEVISNRAIELAGGRMGTKEPIHPNDHVNMAQSTNDTIPSAIYISAFEAVRDDLVPALKTLKSALMTKSGDFDKIVKAGRTHLQDAVPIRLGQEFSGYTESVHNDLLGLQNASKSLLKLPIGGNALGTGINAHPRFRQGVIDEIRKTLLLIWGSVPPAAKMFKQGLTPIFTVSAYSSLRSL